MPTTPRGYPLLTADQKYALVSDYNKLAMHADAANTVTEARAQETADAAKAYALDISTRSADRAMKVATDALATVAPVRALVDSANAKADQAVSTADAAYRYNQSLTGALPEQIDAVLADGQSDAGQRLLQRVHVGDTYVGVTQQPGATMVDKLHAALAEASSSGGVVMLPDHPIDVGTGLKMAGYSCGIVGRQTTLTGAQDNPTVGRSTIHATQQVGPAMDFTGFVWPMNYRSRLPFRDFGVRGSGVADPNGANHGMFITGMSGVSVFDNIVITGCGGTGLFMEKSYFPVIRDLLIAIGPTATGAPSPRAAAFYHVSGGDITLLAYASWWDRNVTRTDGLIHVGDYGAGGSQYTLHSAQNDFRFVFENFHLAQGATLVQHRGHDNRITLVPFDVHGLEGTTGHSYMRLEPSEHYFPLAGGNEVVGRIPGADPGSKITVQSGIVVSQPANAIVGTRAYRNRNVVLRPGSAGTHVNLRGAFSNTIGQPGVVDESGPDEQHSIRDWVAYPSDGQNPAPVIRGTAETRTDTTSTTYDDIMRVDLAAQTTYRVHVEVHYESPEYARLRLTPPSSATLSLVWDHPDKLGALRRTMQAESDYIAAYGPGRNVAVATGTLTTTTASAAILQWRAATNSGATTTLHPQTRIIVERIA